MSHAMDVMFSSESMEWGTPSDLFNVLNDKFRFTLDPCATKENAKCTKFYTKDDDGLTKDWSGETVFVNPPYGRVIGKWVKKCHDEYLKGTTIVLLIPSRTDTIYQHSFVFNQARAVLFMKGRLKFVNGDCTDSAPFPSQIAIFSKRLTREQKDMLKSFGCLTVPDRR
jgi:phage N-6-adenine-methyltransferase